DSNWVRYYLAEAVRDGAMLLGVAVVRIEFDALEAAWERAGERDLVTDEDGVAFLASDPAYKYRLLGPAAARGGNAQELARRYPGITIAPVDVAVLERRDTDSIIRVAMPGNTASYLYQSMPLAGYGWTIHRLTDLASVREDQRDGTIIGGTIA